MDGPDQEAERRHFLIRFWLGHEKLWKAYWLLGVVGGWLFATLVENLVEVGWLGQIPRLVLLVSYSLFSAVCIWRCAFNAGWRGWGYGARGILLLGLILFVAGIGGFL